MTGARLVVEDLRVTLAGTQIDVVDDVSFSVGPGEILGLVGESGSGKTSVALALLGYARRGLRLDGGQVLLDGNDMLSASEGELQHLRGSVVAYVPQDPASALNPTLRVGSQLREALRFHADRSGSPLEQDLRLKQVLTDVGLDSVPHLMHAYPHQLSGGQQQRATIAMAFALRPQLIVLDEPTTGLDVSTQRQVLNTVRSLCDSYGSSAVYVSHDLAVVGELATSVVVLYAGRVMEAGPTALLFRESRHPYTNRLLRAVPSLDRLEVLEGIPGQPPRPTRRPPGCAFAPRCSFAEEECSQSEISLIELDEGRRRVRCRRINDIEDQFSSDSVATSRAHPDPDASWSTEPLLNIQRLCASYGTKEVLSNIAFEVRPEECVAIVGESGSGKTTLARCIAGLHARWSGELTFAGNPLEPTTRRRDKRTLESVQYVFQNPYTSLNPRKTVGQSVEESLIQFRPEMSRGERRSHVVEALSEVSLGPDSVRRFPDQLSGGERQRVAIARALVARPRLLLCDEVTSALDVSIQATVIEMLRRLQVEHRLAMIFITHNLALVRSIAQSVVVLSEGRIVESGPVTAVLDRPQHAYTVGLIANIPHFALNG